MKSEGTITSAPNLPKRQRHDRDWDGHVDRDRGRAVGAGITAKGRERFRPAARESARFAVRRIEANVLRPASTLEVGADP
jgi:hypothetical protein